MDDNKNPHNSLLNNCDFMIALDIVLFGDHGYISRFINIAKYIVNMHPSIGTIHDILVIAAELDETEIIIYEADDEFKTYVKTCALNYVISCIEKIPVGELMRIIGSISLPRIFLCN
jgi:hypothetical protein